MRFLWPLVLLATLAFAPPPATASTFSLPLAGEIEIVGDIPTPVSISISAAVTPLGASYWVVNIGIEQSGSVGGPFSEPQGCVGAFCGTLAGFYVCGGGIGCGVTLVPGTVMPRGDPVSFDVSDTSRFLMIDTFVQTDSPVGLNLTANLPDGLQILIISDPMPEGVAQTPLPAALPLFATGLGAIGLLGLRRKRKTEAV